MSSGAPQYAGSASLLHGPPAPAEPGPDDRFAYRPGAAALISAFVLYHLAVLLIWNAPSKELTRPFQSSFLRGVGGYAYFAATRNAQSWAMFAPNPDRTNNFVQVFVIDEQGGIWDFGQDIWAEDRHPYLWYDRRGKVNRNIDGKSHYQRIYGAWVCREWERQHGGEPARAVRFIKRWTKIPEPAAVIQAGGWDPWAGPYEEFEQETITCATAIHGTLPDELRARYGLPPLEDPARFLEVESHSWWDERNVAE